MTSPLLNGTNLWKIKHNSLEDGPTAHRNKYFIRHIYCWVADHHKYIKLHKTLTALLIQLDFVPEVSFDDLTLFWWFWLHIDLQIDGKNVYNVIKYKSLLVSLSGNIEFKFWQVCRYWKMFCFGILKCVHCSY